MWGKVNHTHLVGLNSRFNPTHVGKSYLKAVIDAKVSVQPHACGEKSDEHRKVKLEFGSTPRMWGKAPGSILSNSFTRFNPTHVGKRLKVRIVFYILCQLRVYF